MTDSRNMRHMWFNFDKIKREAIFKIETKAFDMDGILFGGAVRDEIIASTYASRYYKGINRSGEIVTTSAKKFWDTSYHPETAARTLVPNDMDIYFHDTAKSEAFIRELYTMCASEGAIIDTAQTFEDAMGNNHKYTRNVNVKKVMITIVVGKFPFSSFGGYNVDIDIDVVTPVDQRILIQPPFQKLDFLCNGFIKTKLGITYSRDTGTYIDTLTEMERTAEILKIQQDMLQFKTNFCMFEKIKYRDIGKFGNNSCAFKRINKLLAKETFAWTICNLPFTIANATEEDCDTECCVCCDKFEVGDRITYTLTTTEEGKQVRTGITHKHCLMEYFANQDLNAHVVDFLHHRDDFTFVCTMRSKIDFTKCPCTYKPPNV